MKKQTILYLVAGIAAFVLVAGGWYAYQYRECVKKVSYVSPREGRDAGGGFYGSLHSLDKGDYYLFFPQKFKTSDDAIRACIWK